MVICKNNKKKSKNKIIPNVFENNFTYFRNNFHFNKIITKTNKIIIYS